MWEAGADDLPPAEEVLDQVAASGYAGMELGPPGWLGDGDGERAAERLEQRGLALVAFTATLHLSRAEQAAAELHELPRLLEEVERSLPSGGERPRAVLADAVAEPDRIGRAGAIEQHPETWLGDRRARLLADNAQRAAELCLQLGFDPSFHPSLGSYVETPREVARFFDLVDPGLVTLCLDTGHSVAGGGDPVALLGELGELVRHVHLKDVDAERRWRPLGDGVVPLAAVLDDLRARSYAGWLVVEVPHEPGDLTAALRDAEADRERLRELGVDA